MKKYRDKGIFMYIILLPTILAMFIADLNLPTLIRVNYDSLYWVILLIAGYNVWAILSYLLFFRYIEIDDGVLYVKSTLPPYHRKELSLKEIQKVSIYFGRNNQIRITYKTGKRYSFVTAVMDNRLMLGELLEDLRAEGIEVEPVELLDDIARQKRSWERQRQWKERMQQKKKENSNKAQTS